MKYLTDTTEIIKDLTTCIVKCDVLSAEPILLKIMALAANADEEIKELKRANQAYEFQLRELNK